MGITAATAIAPSLPDALRDRPIEAVAYSACDLLLRDGAIAVRIDDGRGTRQATVMAALQREYRIRQRSCLRKADAAAWLAHLDFEMGLRAIETLAACLCQLFGLGEDDAPRRALMLECVAALADKALVCADEAAYLQRSHEKDGACAPQPVGRVLTLSRSDKGGLRLRKETSWAKPGAATAPASPRPPLGPDGADVANRAGQDGQAPTTSSVDAVLTPAMSTPRRRNGVLQLRGKLIGHIEPVRIDDPAAPAAVSISRDRWSRCRALMRWIVDRLLRRAAAPGTRKLREVRLLIHPAPPDGRKPVVIRVGDNWKDCVSCQPLWRGIDVGWDEVRRHAEQLSRRLFEPRPADHADGYRAREPEVRCY